MASSLQVSLHTHARNHHFMCSFQGVLAATHYPPEYDHHRIGMTNPGCLAGSSSCNFNKSSQPVSQHSIPAEQAIYSGRRSVIFCAGTAAVHHMLLVVGGGIKPEREHFIILPQTTRYSYQGHVAPLLSTVVRLEATLHQRVCKLARRRVASYLRRSSSSLSTYGRKQGKSNRYRHNEFMRHTDTRSFPRLILRLRRSIK